MRDRRLQRVETVVQWQQRVATEGDDDRLFLDGAHRQARLLGPVGISATEVRVFHFATIFLLIP